MKKIDNFYTSDLLNMAQKEGLAAMEEIFTKHKCDFSKIVIKLTKEGRLELTLNGRRLCLMTTDKYDTNWLTFDMDLLLKVDPRKQLPRGGYHDDMLVSCYKICMGKN